MNWTGRGCGEKGEGREGDVCAAITGVLMRRVVLKVDPWEGRMHEGAHIKTRSGRCGAYRYIFQSWMCRLWLDPLSGEGFMRSTHMIRSWWAARICSQLHGCRIHVAEVCNLDVPCTFPSSPGLSPVQRLPEHVAGFWQIYLVSLLQIHKDY